MIVYTVQTEEAWKQFKKQGHLEGNKKEIDPEFIYTYDWMVYQAKNRLPHYKGDYPVWVWEENNYPNRNAKAWGREKQKMVILTLDVPEEWVLWSEFSYWCCAMSEGSRYKNQLSKAPLHEWFELMNEEYGIIFDFEYLLTHPDWYLGTEDTMKKQGVIGRIPLVCVKKVRRFRAKEEKCLKRNKSENWENRNENRLKKMNRKFRKRNEKLKRVKQRLIRK
ncbi:DUF3841 domain-containing protein [Bacillus bombysepticus]|uniref:DUF3841 domain-containing protein n=1 Tax=Bacillus bombysepticus TaxID=658666 RepID=UPI003016D69A